MATFVLVPGAWHGGWCWKKVTAPVRTAGHEVFAPSLTGLGERSHLAAPNVNLTTHVQDVIGVPTYEDLHGVILVGHSYAGMVITAITGAFRRALGLWRNMRPLWSAVDYGDSVEDRVDRTDARSLWSSVTGPAQGPRLHQGALSAALVSPATS